MVGSENRIQLIAADLVEHFENRQSVMPGKAMVVVMSRRIAVELYRELVAPRPARRSFSLRPLIQQTLRRYPEGPVQLRDHPQGETSLSVENLVNAIRPADSTRQVLNGQSVALH